MKTVLLCGLATAPIEGEEWNWVAGPFYRPSVEEFSRALRAAVRAEDPAAVVLRDPLGCVDVHDLHLIQDSGIAVMTVVTETTPTILPRMLGPGLIEACDLLAAAQPEAELETARRHTRAIVTAWNGPDDLRPLLERATRKRHKGTVLPCCRGLDRLK